MAGTAFYLFLAYISATLGNGILHLYRSTSLSPFMLLYHNSSIFPQPLYVSDELRLIHLRYIALQLAYSFIEPFLIITHKHPSCMTIIKQGKNSEKVSLLTRHSDEERSGQSISQLSLWFHAICFSNSNSSISLC